MKTKKKEYNTVEIKGEFAQLLKDIQKQNKQKDTEIKQLQDELDKYGSFEESKMTDKIKKLEKQLADVEKENKMYEALSKDLGITFKLYEKNMCKNCKKKIIKLIKEVRE